MKFSVPDNAALAARLRRPTGPVKVVLDTDAYNEIDDQYALAYLVRSGLPILGIHAAPFCNQHAANPKEGMEKSYQEIFKVLSLLGREDLNPLVYAGSQGYLEDEDTPRPSPAAEHLVELARALPQGEQLYVAAIGAITNVSSALLKAPEIAEQLVVVWLGGNAHYWPDTRDFHLFQDVAAARVLCDSGVALVQLPCMGVVTHLATTEPELREQLKGKSPIGTYLYDITCAEAKLDKMGRCWSRVIWDVSTIAWLLGGEHTMRDSLVHAPYITYDGTYSFSNTRHLMKYVDYINRDAVFDQLFRLLQN